MKVWEWPSRVIGHRFESSSRKHFFYQRFFPHQKNFGFRALADPAIFFWVEFFFDAYKNSQIFFLFSVLLNNVCLSRPIASLGDQIGVVRDLAKLLEMVALSLIGAKKIERLKGLGDNRTATATSAAAKGDGKATKSAKKEDKNKQKQANFYNFFIYILSVYFIFTFCRTYS